MHSRLLDKVFVMDILDMSSADLLVATEDRPVSMLGNNSPPFDSSTDFAAARRRTFGVRTPKAPSNAGDLVPVRKKDASTP